MEWYWTGSYQEKPKSVQSNSQTILNEVGSFLLMTGTVIVCEYAILRSRFHCRILAEISASISWLSLWM